MVTRDDVIEVLQMIVDPELYIDIWTLGLIYEVDVVGDRIDIAMTFTSMACPAGPEMIGEVKASLLELPGIEGVDVEVVFDPPWEPSEDLKAMLGIG